MKGYISSIQFMALPFNHYNSIFLLLWTVFSIFTVDTATPSTTNRISLLAATPTCSTSWLTATAIHQQSHPLLHLLHILWCVPEYAKHSIFQHPAITIQRSKNHLIGLCLLLHVKNPATSHPVIMEGFKWRSCFIFWWNSVPYCLMNMVEPLNDASLVRMS